MEKMDVEECMSFDFKVVRLKSLEPIEKGCFEKDCVDATVSIDTSVGAKNFSFISPCGSCVAPDESLQINLEESVVVFFILFFDIFFRFLIFNMRSGGDVFFSVC